MLTDLNYDNRFTDSLPADPVTENYRRQVLNACYSPVHPSKASKPKLLAYWQEVAELLDLTQTDCAAELFTEVFSGNKTLPGMAPYASCYGGHQFGHWAGQLGDGRAINLAEVLNSKNQRWVLQLKGAGLTPYSRTADGLAVLRSSVREFLCSEAMFHLGVPTTRALSLITTGEQVVRDMFYDGNPQAEAGAVVCRVSPSFTRFGSFEIFTARNDRVRLKQLVDHTIRTDFPHLGEPCDRVYLDWFSEVCHSTAELMVHWMRVGFVHGVMNTDNMSILGLTIDYGPYGWLEDYDPNWTPNTTDAQGRRYCFINQPQIAFWNLAQLGQALTPLVDATELQQVLDQYPSDFEGKYNEMMCRKLGLDSFDAKTDPELFDALFALLQLTETDMTLYFRQLAQIDIKSESSRAEVSPDRLSPLMTAYYDSANLNKQVLAKTCEWLSCYQQRLQTNKMSNPQRLQLMNTNNPKFVLRNYLAQMAIDKAEQEDYSVLHELMEVMRNPYAEQNDKEHYAEKRPEWARNRAGCSMLSCSS